MVQPANRDLFEGSKMTFGEHLDELRAALIRSILAIMVGFLIGLYFGHSIVSFIQSPMVTALESYYADQAAPEYVAVFDAQLARGEPLPSAFDGFAELSAEDKAEMVKQLLAEKQMLPEVVYVDPAELIGELKNKMPETFGDVDLPGRDPGQINTDRMVQIFFWRPFGKDDRTRLKSLSGPEPFMVYIKASLLFGFVLSSPAVFYYIWMFIGAGLYPHEKHYVHVFLPFSLALFLAGAALAFFVVFRYVLGFLLMFNASMGIDPDPRISEWLGFALVLPLGFGVSFQLPLVMLFLERIGVLSIATYLEKWRIAVLVIFVLSMLLTPADPTSMILMAVPLTGLYFGGILLCRFMPRRKTPFGDVIT